MGLELHGDPARVSAQARRSALEHYAPEEIVAVLLNIICYSMNKVRAASGFDQPADPDKLTAFHYDDQGIAHIIDRDSADADGKDW